jgi:hypothetical protein
MLLLFVGYDAREEDWGEGDALHQLGIRFGDSHDVVGICRT